MSIRLGPILAQVSLQRVLAGIVFVPLMAYSFAPFRYLSLSFSQRLLFWSGVLLLACAAVWVAGRLVRQVLVYSDLVVRDLVFALLILMLFVPSLWLLTLVHFSLNGLMPPGFLMVVPYGVLFATGLLLVRQREKPQVPETPARAGPRLFTRLPDGFEGQIYRLAVRDHSVDVITSDGVFTIRSRLTDAIAEMEPVPGRCTHRSHWIADAAIVGAEKQGGKTFLRICNDDLVPVSRKYKPMLEEEGLL